MVNLADQLEKGIIWKVLEREFALGGVTRVLYVVRDQHKKYNTMPRGRATYRLPQDCVAITRDNLASVESTPDVLLDGIVRRVLAQLGLHLRQPGQHFLVCETVQWSGETIQSGAVRKEGIRERRSDELAGVGGDVSPFVVTVDGDVEAEKLNECWLIGEAK